MANDKWSKWVVGISTVAVFTSFLHLTKTSSQPDHSPQPITLNPGGFTPISVEQEEKIELFVHSREDMRQLEQLNPAGKSERERLLASLDWDNLPDGEITIPSQVIQPISVIQPATVIKPAQEAKTTKPGSDRRTRRS